MVLRVTLSLALLILGRPNEATLKAEAPAQACKSTVTGALELIPLESKVYGNKRLQLSRGREAISRALPLRWADAL